MNLPVYKEILKKGKEFIDENLAGVRAKRGKAQAVLEMAKLDEEIATKQAKIQELCSEKELNFIAIIRAQDDLALLGRRKDQFQEIIDQMFPDE